MPIYEYKCEKGHVFEVVQRMTDEALTECQECGAPAVRILHSPAVHFKGSGFYNTDYGKKKGGGPGSPSDGESKSSDSGDSGSSSDPKPSESKSSDSKSGDSKAKAASAD